MVKCKIFSQEHLKSENKREYGSDEGFIYDSRQELEDRINKWIESNKFEVKIISTNQSYNDISGPLADVMGGGISITIFYEEL